MRELFCGKKMSKTTGTSNLQMLKSDLFGHFEVRFPEPEQVWFNQKLTRNPMRIGPLYTNMSIYCIYIYIYTNMSICYHNEYLKGKHCFRDLWNGVIV